MQLFQINQSARSSKITINAHTTIGQLDQRSITSAAHYNRIYSTHPGRIYERHVVPGVEATLLQQQARDLLRLLVQLGAGQRLQDSHDP